MKSSVNKLTEEKISRESLPKISRESLPKSSKPPITAKQRRGKERVSKRVSRSSSSSRSTSRMRSTDSSPRPRRSRSGSKGRRRERERSHRSRRKRRHRSSSTRRSRRSQRARSRRARSKDSFYSAADRQYSVDRFATPEPRYSEGREEASDIIDVEDSPTVKSEEVIYEGMLEDLSYKLPVSITASLSETYLNSRQR